MCRGLLLFNKKEIEDKAINYFFIIYNKSTISFSYLCFHNLKRMISMKASRAFICITLLLFIFSSYSLPKDVPPPTPYGVIPTADQIRWQQLEYYMFIHFGPNTFTNVEWGDGKEDPKVFNPTDLDCRQWAATAKAAGMKGIIITAKHHDGFCLWPSNYSTHTVRESPWKDGKGDVLRELSDACKEYGLKFGVYLSPWDQNHPAYGTPEYNQIFANTLDEVLSGYGEVFEQWFDGANGEGHGGKKQVYDWDMFHKVVYRNQPQAIIFSDIGPGCRWMGNERGIAGETNWSTLNVKGFGPGREAPASEILNEGNMNGEAWVPAETDVSIRPGWFYSPATDNKVKTLEHLMDIYYTSVGRNSNLLLNVPPDRRGRIHPNDSIRLMEFRKAREEAFEDDIMKGGVTITANNIRGNSSIYSINNVLNDNYDSYWATDDTMLDPTIEIDLGKEQTFNRLLLQEYIPLGQRVKEFSVQYWDNASEDWKDLTAATTIGYKRILRFSTISTRRLKIQLLALACPTLNKVSVYNAPDILEEKKAESNDLKVMDAKNWTLLLPESGNLSRITDNKDKSYMVIDINTPLVIDIGETTEIKGFFYKPVPKVQSASNILKYNLHICADANGREWIQMKDNAIFSNIANNPVTQYVIFDKPVKCRLLQLYTVETVDDHNNKNKYFVNELGLILK